jgi:hypothetical protein
MMKKKMKKMILLLQLPKQKLLKLIMMMIMKKMVMSQLVHLHLYLKTFSNLVYLPMMKMKKKLTFQLLKNFLSVSKLRKRKELLRW